MTPADGDVSFGTSQLVWPPRDSKTLGDEAYPQPFTMRRRPASCVHEVLASFFCHLSDGCGEGKPLPREASHEMDWSLDARHRMSQGRLAWPITPRSPGCWCPCAGRRWICGARGCRRFMSFEALSVREWLCRSWCGGAAPALVSVWPFQGGATGDP